MLMRTLILRAVAFAVVLSPALVLTQGGRTKPTTATYITKEEVDIVNSQGQGIDRNIRTVDIGHENFSDAIHCLPAMNDADAEVLVADVDGSDVPIDSLPLTVDNVDLFHRNLHYRGRVRPSHHEER